jgi:hypothetical protein
MKIAIATIALIAAIPFALLADKDKDVTVKVPDKSGVSVVDITGASGPGLFAFKLENSNSYPVHVSGKYIIPYAFHLFDEELKANESKLMTRAVGEKQKLTEIIIDKVEKVPAKD